MNDDRTNEKTAHGKRWAFALLMLTTLFLQVWGIRKDMPYVPEADEPLFVVHAGRMAQTGSLNPGWFGNPGSTVIYPLAALFRIFNAFRGSSPDFTSVNALPWEFEIEHAPYYYIGRALTIAYMLACMPLLVLIGRQAFGRERGFWAGILAGVMFTTSRMVVYHTQIVRTDSPGAFFCLLSIWLILRACEHPSTKSYILAGLSIGLATATRYLMLSLGGVLGLALLLNLWQRRRERPEVMRIIGYGALSGVMVVVGFFVTSPFVLLDFYTVAGQLALEARSIHPGADGLNFAGRLVWYFTAALPDMFSKGQIAFAVLGLILCVFMNRRQPLIIFAYVVLYFVSISVMALHWHRWLIQVLPLIGLFGGYGVIVSAEWLGKKMSSPLFPGKGLWPAAIATTLFLIVSWTPIRQVCRHNIISSNESTHKQARRWVEQNISPKKRIAQEWFTIPMAGLPHTVIQVQSMAHLEPEMWARAGEVDYIVISDMVYRPFLNTPGRYAAEKKFYRRLLKSPAVIRSFNRGKWHGGGRLHILDARKITSEFEQD